MKIKPNHGQIRYSGRIHWVEGNPVWIHPSTSMYFKFTGDYLSITVHNRRGEWDTYLGCIVDGEQRCISLPNCGENTFEIPLEKKIEHEILLFKRQDTCHEVRILEIILAENGTILDLSDWTERRIEVYGDSVSAGEVVEALDYVGKEDLEHNGEFSNSWYSFGWITARKLGAEIHNISQGGIALLDKTGYFLEPDSIGMETAWDKINYNPSYGSVIPWDFSKYIPQVVIVAIGQNDSHPEDYMKEDYNSVKSENWRKNYKKFLRNLRGVYPDAFMICCTTILNHDISWDKSIDQVVNEMQDERIKHFLFQRNGRGTPGHPRIPESEEMAAELTEYITQLHVWQ